MTKKSTAANKAQQRTVKPVTFCAVRTKTASFASRCARRYVSIAGDNKVSDIEMKITSSLLKSDESYTSLQYF
ncbi:hypothetical protein [Pseudoalteromonas sp. T1lg24]|uniref:hypothetical protein n=1 Tax=Pseudoalteromonas sp. T1lg24 TaxID=2077099 RepID=UPI000CF62BF8|nr:hypothetical protein [Pseudoalteromonas sp. T1lg24]